MDNFADTVRKNKEVFTPNITGACLDCQVCEETVSDAYHDHVSNMLVWKCSEGHVSSLKDFLQ